MTSQTPIAPPDSDPAHGHSPESTHAAHIGAHRVAPANAARSVLAWPAWLRVAAVLPLVLLLWLAVLWANEGAGLW
ncbi:MAG: hypothetical protein CO105_07455 [Comamonadaceae bacterium CG_4_9_14_3_um_filter_60_33]|nr:MAG: hypothetical protein CO105_07455 [Comamonadaceae bacterium CG_4_9_14_3_um_filter_60_33]